MVEFFRGDDSWDVIRRDVVRDYPDWFYYEVNPVDLNDLIHQMISQSRA